MLPQVSLLSLVLSPVIFYLGSAAVFTLLSHLNIIKTDNSNKCSGVNNEDNN